jgi:acyl-CoA dehydrogenase
VNTVAHQLHGAIGVTIEHRLWRSTMRAQSWIGEFGTAAQYARELGYLALGADDVWDLVTTGTSRGPSNLQDANP